MTIADKNNSTTFYLELFIRLVASIFLFAFIDTLFQYDYLIGEKGMVPISQFVKSIQSTPHHLSLTNFPGLFLINSSNTFILCILLIGCVASFLALIGLYTPIGVLVACICWLSFINSGSDFFIYIWDTLLFEGGVIAFLISCFNQNGLYTKLIVFLPKLLLFRLWLSMGLVIILYNNHAESGGEFIRYFFQNQPMPTSLAFYMYHLPTTAHTFIYWLLVFTEIVVPFFIFIPRLKPFAFFIFITFSILIECVGNFAWFNILTIVMCIPLLINTNIGDRLFKYLHEIPLSRKRLGFPVKLTPLLGLLYFQITLQSLFLLAMFFPIGNRYLNFLNYFDRTELFEKWENKNIFTKCISAPIHFGTALKLANPYGVFKGIPVKRWELEFEMCSDSLSQNCKNLIYFYKPGFNNEKSFFAPHFPRLEQQLFYESQQGSFYKNYTPFNSHAVNWPKNFAALILKTGDYRNTDPLNPIFSHLNVNLLQFDFNAWEDYVKTGNKWVKKTICKYQLSLDNKNFELVPEGVFRKYNKHSVN